MYSPMEGGCQRVIKQRKVKKKTERQTDRAEMVEKM